MTEPLTSEEIEDARRHPLSFAYTNERWLATLDAARPSDELTGPSTAQMTKGGDVHVDRFTVANPAPAGQTESELLDHIGNMGEAMGELIDAARPSDEVTGLDEWRNHIPSGYEDTAGYGGVSCSCGWDSSDVLGWEQHINAEIAALANTKESDGG